MNQENKAKSKENLSDRGRDVLDYLIADYIATAAAVGSRQIAKKFPQRLSPATIRNVLQDLEEMGYLSQPHTSAGRIPTSKALRFYVDTLIQKQPLTAEEHQKIEAGYNLSKRDIRSIMQGTSRLLASLSQHVGIVLTPKLEKTKFKHIEFLPLSKRRLLGIFVTQTGNVENRIIETTEEFSYSELERINNFCNARLFGLTLEEAREKLSAELSNEQVAYDRLMRKALLLSQELLDDMQTTELVVEGEGLLKSIEEKEQMLKMMDECLNSPGVRIFIGKESRLTAAQNVSVIAATYSHGSNLLGTLGVIGPTSMNYSHVISIVDATANMVSNFLENR